MGIRDALRNLGSKTLKLGTIRAEVATKIAMGLDYEHQTLRWLARVHQYYLACLELGRCVPEELGFMPGTVKPLWRSKLSKVPDLIKWVEKQGKVIGDIRTVIEQLKPDNSEMEWQIAELIANYLCAIQRTRIEFFAQWVLSARSHDAVFKSADLLNNCKTEKFDSNGSIRFKLSRDVKDGIVLLSCSTEDGNLSLSELFVELEKEFKMSVESVAGDLWVAYSDGKDEIASIVKEYKPLRDYTKLYNAVSRCASLTKTCANYATIKSNEYKIRYAKQLFSMLVRMVTDFQTKREITVASVLHDVGDARDIDNQIAVITKNSQTMETMLKEGLDSMPDELDEFKKKIDDLIKKENAFRKGLINSHEKARDTHLADSYRLKEIDDEYMKAYHIIREYVSVKEIDYGLNFFRKSSYVSGSKLANLLYRLCLIKGDMSAIYRTFSRISYLIDYTRVLRANAARALITKDVKNSKVINDNLKWIVEDLKRTDTFLRKSIKVGSESAESIPEGEDANRNMTLRMIRTLENLIKKEEALRKSYFKKD